MSDSPANGPADPQIPGWPQLATADDARRAGQQLFRDLGRLAGPKAIDDQGYVGLGGLDQWVSIRGQDRDAPILLFLHGGPGSVISDVSYAYQRGWEDFFVVVNWDQRGAGRSAGPIEKASEINATLNREQYIADAVELIEHLLARFGQRRIILTGQSWGTVLALEITKRRPDLLHVTVLQGLAVEWLASVEWILAELIRVAEAEGDTAEAERLRAAGPLPSADDPEALFAWIPKFGRPIPDANTWFNIAGDGDGWGRRMELLRYFSPDLPSDVFKAQAEITQAHADAVYERHKMAMSAAIRWNAPMDVGYEFETPILVMQGQHDWQTHTDIARAYFDRIQAPWKKWVEFPHAAHALNIEQPGLSVVTLVRDALPWALGRAANDS